MKIQDIFNLPKNRGGAKLFQRIMNRYGIPKEDSKELKNNIDNSSSGGGSKMEYYKLNKEKYGDEEGSPLHLAFNISFCYPSIVKANDGDMIKFCAPMVTMVTFESELSNILPMWEGIAFDPNIKTCIYNPGYVEYNCNNLQELIKYLETTQGMSWKDDALIPITEEEFYNLD